jgi:hypothetical protein
MPVKAKETFIIRVQALIVTVAMVTITVRSTSADALPATEPAAAAVGAIVVGRGGAPDAEVPSSMRPVAAAAAPVGLWLADADGRVVGVGGATSLGDLERVSLNAPIVGMAATRSRAGYWLVASDGGVFSFGDARFFGSTGGMRLNQPIVGLAATPSGAGYWLVASDGGVFSFGDARFFGSTGSMTLNKPVIGMSSSLTGAGYRLVASDGGIFSFGDAPFLGSTGATVLTSPMVAMATVPGSTGYWMITAGADLYGFGAAAPEGARPDGAAVAIVARPSGGLWLVGSGRALLPGGTTEVFAGGRMLVAHYGSPASPLLGVLGEKPPAAAVQAVIDRARQYGTVGTDVVPALEIIATIANKSPGPDGDYSTPLSLSALEPWIAEATRRDAFVILDLQPGRGDFLPQAKALEPLLRLPNVGLALDPEWHVGPNQVPARVIGSVDGSEVNAVSAWLDALVVANRLPEKLFVLHQFTDEMVRNREVIVDRPNLASVFHCDGFGGRQAKLGDLQRYCNDPPFYTGFKLFLDEDTNLFSPTEVLSLVPRPNLVTYQ